MILTLGSRGDVQPYVALGKALTRAGHDVTLATHEAFRALIEDNGLSFALAGGDVREQINTPEAKQWVESANDFGALVRGFKALMAPALEAVTIQSLAAARACKAEAVLGSGTAFYFAYSLAEALGIPYVHALLQPIHPTVQYPSPLIPSERSYGPIYNYVSYMYCGQMFWRAMESTFNGIRERVLDLPPVSPSMGPVTRMNELQQPVIYGFSKYVLPPSSNWAKFIHVTGYWFLDDDRWQPLPQLQAFLENGPPPVCIGFGSMADTDPQRLTDAVCSALKKTKQRGILLSGWGGLTAAQADNDLFVMDQAPHSWLFPKCIAVSHHCGAGTTAAVLRAGVPGVPVPFFADQPFWGARTYKMKVASRPINRKYLNADNFADAIQYALNDKVRERASVLGENIQRENGAATAADILTATLT